MDSVPSLEIVRKTWPYVMEISSNLYQRFTIVR
jgi:hypothetical protein